MSLQPSREPKFLFDPYLDWAERQGVPVTEDFFVNIHDVPTGPWPLFDARGGLVHLKGRGDFVSVFAIEIPAGSRTSPQRHIFEEVIFVVEGHGSTTIEAQDGRKHTFEWGPNSLFALPLNARYQHFNGSGRERALLASTNNLCLVLNLYHNEDFIFANDAVFPDRQGKQSYFSGEGDFIPKRAGRHMWETNFVPDVAKFELQRWDARGGGSSNMKFILADGTMHAHSSEMPVGTYKKGHRHGPDFHVYTVTGTGYSLLWYGDNEPMRVDWRHGSVFAPPDMMYHQHFNTANVASRYLAVALGSLRYPFTSEKRALFAGVDVSVKDGGRQIEYKDQDPRIHEIFLTELAKNGIESKMGDKIDETPYRRKTA
jgi:cupin superfamily acireductone dioxygenase involved in methionine salvage